MRGCGRMSRSSCSIWWTGSGYLVTCYDNVAACCANPATFSSRIMADVIGPVMGRTILEMDGTEHTQPPRPRLARLPAPGARGDLPSSWSARMVHEILDLAAGGAGRAGGQLTPPYPMSVIARRSACRSPTTPTFQQWFARHHRLQAGDPRRVFAASQGLRDFLARSWRSASAEPTGRPDQRPRPGRGRGVRLERRRDLRLSPAAPARGRRDDFPPSRQPALRPALRTPSTVEAVRADRRS